LANIKKQWGAVKRIKTGDLLFLYNTKSRSLIGPFIAESEGGWQLDPEAWDYMKPLEFPAQVRVKWDDLRMLENAGDKFEFLARRETCELTPEQTDALLSALKDAPIYIPPVSKTLPFEIESEAERMFAQFLDKHNINYIRFSQTPADFSKVLREMKAKRPDFLVFLDEPLFIEVKPRPKKNELIVDSQEVEKLKQLELTTKIRVLIAFPTNNHGIEWRSTKPAWIWARGQRKKFDDQEILATPIEMLEHLKF